MHSLIFGWGKKTAPGSYFLLWYIILTVGFGKCLDPYLYHVRSINHNIPVGEGFWDGQLLAGVIGEPSPTKIAVARPDMILVKIYANLKARKERAFRTRRGAVSLQIRPARYILSEEGIQDTRRCGFPTANLSIARSHKLPDRINARSHQRPIASTPDRINARSHQRPIA
jgi:hypothetical protein